MDRRLVKKVRKNAKLFIELFEPWTQYIYSYPIRKRIEVEGGYRIARKCGARLDEVQVFNLLGSAVHFPMMVTLLWLYL